MSSDAAIGRRGRGDPVKAVVSGDARTWDGGSTVVQASGRPATSPSFAGESDLESTAATCNAGTLNRNAQRRARDAVLKTNIKSENEGLKVDIVELQSALDTLKSEIVEIKVHMQEQIDELVESLDVSADKDSIHERLSSLETLQERGDRQIALEQLAALQASNCRDQQHDEIYEMIDDMQEKTGYLHELVGEIPERIHGVIHELHNSVLKNAAEWQIRVEDLEEQLADEESHSDDFYISEAKSRAKCGIFGTCSNSSSSCEESELPQENADLRHMLVDMQCSGCGCTFTGAFWTSTMPVHLCLQCDGELNGYTA